eukprot:4149325-Prymnesium_polylepis.1
MILTPSRRVKSEGHVSARLGRIGGCGHRHAPRRASAHAGLRCVTASHSRGEYIRIRADLSQ